MPSGVGSRERNFPSVLGKAKSAYTAAQSVAALRWQGLKRRRPSVAHIAAAWRRMQSHNGNQYAAAITYFSFLALFPLLLLAAAVTGFVLHSHPVAQQELIDHITANVPGNFGQTLATSIHTLINNRTGVGLVGLFGVLLTGLGWISNLRTAVQAMWGHHGVRRNFFKGKFADLGVLAGLGLALLVSLGLTITGTALADQIVRVFGWQHVPAVHTVVGVLGVVLALLGDIGIFGWLLLRLPGIVVPWRTGVRAAVFAAVGFEILKLVGTYTVAHTAQSLTSGPFASVVAVLVWLQLVARLALICVAWTAVVTATRDSLPMTPYDAS